MPACVCQAELQTLESGIVQEKQALHFSAIQNLKGLQEEEAVKGPHVGEEDKGGVAKQGEGSEKRGKARETDMGVWMRKHVYQ